MYVYMLYAYRCLCVHMWRPEVDIGCLPLFLSTICLREPLTEPVNSPFWLDQLANKPWGTRCLPFQSCDYRCAVLYPAFFMWALGVRPDTNTMGIVLSLEPSSLRISLFHVHTHASSSPHWALPLYFHCDRLRRSLWSSQDLKQWVESLCSLQQGSGALFREDIARMWMNCQWWP